MTARMAQGSGTGNGRAIRATRQVRARWRAAAILVVGVAAANTWAQDGRAAAAESAAESGRTVAVNETLAIDPPRTAAAVATPVDAAAATPDTLRDSASPSTGADTAEARTTEAPTTEALGAQASATGIAASSAGAPELDPESGNADSAANAGAPRRFSETQALGLPRAPLLDAATEAAQGDANLARTIDPRRNEIARVLLALLVVIGLIFAVRFGMRRAAGVLGGGARPAGVLEVLARYPISRGQWLLLLRMGQRIVLLHQGSHGIRTLAEVNDPGEVATLLGRMEAGARASEAAQFRRTLRNFEAEHERMHGSASQGEIVDLTRRRRPPRALFGRRAVG